MRLLLSLILLLTCCSFAYSNEDTHQIRFVYINGSNNNDPKMKKWFFDGIKKTHPDMLKSFNESVFIKEKFLKRGQYSIYPHPEAFFWGDKSSTEIQVLNSNLKFTQFISPRFAQTVRTLLAHYLHDAIWVSHYRNMHPVLDDLHAQIMRDYASGSPVVLFGYSAGAFVAYEYMFNKLPYVDSYDYFLNTNLSDNFKNFVKNNKSQNTCIDALIESKLAVYSADGRLIPNVNENDSKKIYLNLDSYTNKMCTPDGALKGIVNFASPLVLFYSDISNPAYPLTYYNKLLYKYILENDMFWLTVNYADDPLGYPTTRNVSYNDLKNLLDIPITPNNGFLYSKSDIKSRRTFIGAHTSYWATSDKFSKAVVQAYEEGYCLYNE